MVAKLSVLCRPLFSSVGNFLCLGAWQYGKDYDYDAPVKLLDKLLHSMSQSDDEQLVVVSQVIALSRCNLDSYISFVFYGYL